jgi:hypothetical protein
VAAVVSEAELERQRREEEERKQREEQERRANIEWQKRQAEEAEKEWKRRLAARQSAVSQCLTEVDGYPNTPGLRRGIMDAYLDQNGQIHGFGTPEGFYRWTKCVTLRGYPELGMEPEKRK